MEPVEQQQAPPPATLKCDVCQRDYNNHASLVAHRRNVHNIRVRPARVEDARARRIAYQKAYRDKKRAEREGTSMPEMKEKKEHTPKVHVHFCPNCGTNIDAVTMAIKMTS